MEMQITVDIVIFVLDPSHVALSNVAQAWYRERFVKIVMLGVPLSCPNNK